MAYISNYCFVSSKAVVRRCSGKQIAKFTGKHLFWIFRKSLRHQCFPVNFVKLARATFIQCTSSRLFLFHLSLTLTLSGLRGAGGAPMDPRCNSFVDYFFSSMFKKLRPPCNFFLPVFIQSRLFFLKCPLLGKRGGWGPLDPPP